MATQAAGLSLILQNMRFPSFSLPQPPKLEGALQENNWLSKAVKIGENKVYGPESLVLDNGYLYTGLSDGNIVELNPDGSQRKNIVRMSLNSCNNPSGSTQTEHVCGRPLGIRKYLGKHLLVADAYSGLFFVNPAIQNDPYTGKRNWQVLVNARTKMVEGKPLGFINDLVTSKRNGGLILFTSSSSIYPRSRSLDLWIDGEKSGRLLVYRMQDGNVTQALSNLGYPNGVELDANEEFVLVAEGSRARIVRLYLGNPPAGKSKIDIFADNLPGFPNNIRRTDRGTYWVGLSHTRTMQKPSLLDDYGPQPGARQNILNMQRTTLENQARSKGAIAVELDGEGNIIRSLHDPQGLLFNSVSELAEENGYLYIGSIDKPYVGRLKMSDLPPVTNPGDNNTPDEPNPNPNPNQPIDPQIKQFLDRIRQRLNQLDNNKIRDIAIELLKELIQSKLAEMKAKKELEDLKNQLEGSTTPATASTTPETSTQATCEGDKINNCAAYGQEVCSDPKFQQWVADNCCGFCSGKCFGDKISDCASYGASVCSNPAYNDWVQDNCCQYCQEASNTESSTSSPMTTSSSVSDASSSLGASTDATTLSSATDATTSSGSTDPTSTADSTDTSTDASTDAATDTTSGDTNTEATTDPLTTSDSTAETETSTGQT